MIKLRDQLSYNAKNFGMKRQTFNANGPTFDINRLMIIIMINHKTSTFRDKI